MDQSPGDTYVHTDDSLEQVSLTFGIPVSSCKMSWVLRAILALNGVGNASASSNALVCSDWVPPNTAAMASMVVLTMLL